jgi:hypothetical protein
MSPLKLCGTPLEKANVVTFAFVLRIILVLPVLEEVEDVLRGSDEPKLARDYMSKSESCALLRPRSYETRGINYLDDIHHLDDKKISKIGATYEMVILPVAETRERLGVHI